jgi:hypothetical protein
MQAREDCLKPERPHAGATNAQNVVCITATRCVGLIAEVPRVLPAISPHRARWRCARRGPRITATRCVGLIAEVPRVLPAISPHRAHFAARGGGPESPPPAA